MGLDNNYRKLREILILKVFEIKNVMKELTVLPLSAFDFYYLLFPSKTGLVYE